MIAASFCNWLIVLEGTEFSALGGFSEPNQRRTEEQSFYRNRRRQIAGESPYATRPAITACNSNTIVAKSNKARFRSALGKARCATSPIFQCEEAGIGSNKSGNVGQNVLGGVRDIRVGPGEIAARLLAISRDRLPCRHMRHRMVSSPSHITVAAGWSSLLKKAAGEFLGTRNPDDIYLSEQNDWWNSCLLLAGYVKTASAGFAVTFYHRSGSSN